MKIKILFNVIKLNLAVNLVLKGTLILTIAGFTTRIIGFYNRIFLSDLIGATQMGIYQLILPLYMVAFAFTNYGNELALTKLVSEYKSRNDFATIQVFFKICFSINLVLGILFSLFIYVNADWICTYFLKAPRCATCIRIISFGVPFMAMKGSIHGYFLGVEKSGIHAISDLLEQLAKVLSLFLLATYICKKNNYDASFALWGVVIGDIFAFIYSLLALIHHRQVNKQIYVKKNQPIYLRQGIALFLQNSIPLTTNRLALTVLQSIESIMIPSVLLLFYRDSNESLSHYGIFTGMAFPFIMFPSTITNALSTMLLPAVSSAKSSLKKNYLSSLCEKSLHFCLLIGLFSFITFYIYGNDIGMLFFQNKEAGTYLYQLSFLCPFIYLATTLVSILNGLGHATYNLILTICATMIRIGFIQLTIPQFGMTGYLIGLFVSYLFLTFACLHKIQKQIDFHLYFLESIFLPTCLFTILGTCSFYWYKELLSNITPGGIQQLILIIASIAIFGIVSILPFVKFICKAPRQPR